ncbi:MAG: LysR family transcriptional regulator [Microbacteriaceae bacterium]
MLELRRLRLLYELSLRGTLSAVAEALSYSPSTISQQLARLEAEAGVPLLRPDGRRVRLTPQGEALAAYAARVLDLEEGVRSELETMQPGLAPVRVAVLQTAAHAIIPEALTILAEREPGLRVEIAEIPPEEGLFELSARGFDLVVAEQYPGHTREHRDGLERELLGRDRIRLALPPGDDATDLAALRDRAWVMEPVGTAARQWAVQQCRAAGFEPDVRFEVADLMAHIRLIASGHAVGMLPDLVWAGAEPELRLSELPGEPHRDLFTAARRSSTARAGIRAVREALHDALDGLAPLGLSSPAD